MPFLTDAQVERYRKDGFLLIKGVFSAQQLAAMQHAIMQAPFGGGEAFAFPGLQDLWREPHIVEAAKQLLGEPVTFFAEASTLRMPMRVQLHAEGRHLHHDAKGTAENLFNRFHAASTEPYPVIRFGIYLQDFKRHSGGLKVVPGSHLIDSSDFVQNQFTYHDVPSEPGDLVCFCQKLLHSPYALRLRDRPNEALSPDDEDRLSRAQQDVFLPPPNGRDTIFIDYAGAGPLADLHIKSRALHPANAKTSAIRAFSELRLEEHASELGLRLRMDFGMIQAARGIAMHLDGAKIAPAGTPYFKAFSRLCRLSRETSPDHSLFTCPPDESVQTTAAVLSQVLVRMRRLSAMQATVRQDRAMMARIALDALPIETPAPTA